MSTSPTDKMFCLTCGTAGVPRRPPSAFTRHGAKLALAIAAGYLVWRYQPQMWWIAAMSALPVLFDLLLAAPEAPHCATCASSTLIPIDSPRAQRLLREQEKVADRVIAEHDATLKRE